MNATRSLFRTVDRQNGRPHIYKNTDIRWHQWTCDGGNKGWRIVANGDSPIEAYTRWKASIDDVLK